jgi:hypothetical protein
METERVKSIFRNGVRKYSWGIPFAHVFFLTLGLLLMLTSYFIAVTEDGVPWVFAVILAVVGVRIIIIQLVSIIHRDWLDPCRYMLRFLEHKHKNLAWVYFTAGQDADRAKAGEAAMDGLCYTLCFWFANKTCCKVTGKKQVLEQLLMYFNRNYTDISSGYSKELSDRFYRDPFSLKTKTLHTFKVCTGDAPVVYKTERIKRKFVRRLAVLSRAAGIALKIFWFCVSFSISLYFLSTFGWNLYMSLSCSGWPAAEGIVQYAGGSGDGSFITYTYEIDGKTYYGERVTFSGQPGKYIYNYIAGSSVTAYYEPSFPAQSVLVPGGFDPYNYAYLGLGLLFIGIGWIAYGWGIGKYKTVSEPVYWS